MRIDFYLLQKQTSSAIHPFACRLLEKAYQKQNKVYIHCSDINTAEKLDQLLWTFQDISFIPHALTSDKELNEVPISIGWGVIPESDKDICINLTYSSLEKINSFKRIIEIVPEEEPWLTESRKKYKNYQAQNCEIQTHKV